MGYLTPVLIRNDALNRLTENPKEFAQVIKKASQSRNKSWKSESFKLGNFANPIESCGPEHASITRTLVVDGNTIFDLKSVLDDTYKYGLEDYSEKDLDFIENLIEKSEQQISEIKRCVQQERNERE